MSVETMSYLAMLRRMIRAAGRRVAEADEFELAELLALRAELDAAIAASVKGQHDNGRSWAEIGAAAGMSKQAAAKRWAA
ncbi:hypothetical protein [Microbacterium sp. XT11]|uniref:hypothetical protein n=1 Tax=Microbacterium sp. XT11 TaxID=367477 RepID=UPI000742F018|nr:hypothetical protein [Microbacterium sp. XT11]ALX66335.1 hypothetical protein AB663_001431 [Microbacterium sp. XT11]